MLNFWGIWILKEREEGFLSGKIRSQKEVLLVLSSSLSLCNLECQKEHWSHQMCWHTSVEPYLKRASTEDKEAPGSWGRGWSCQTTPEESSSSGTICWHLYKYRKTLMSPLLPGLSNPASYIAAPRMLHEYQFSVDHSPDTKRYMVRCAHGRLASVGTVQTLHEVTAEGLQSFSSPSARCTWESSNAEGLLWSCHMQDPGLMHA